LLKIQFKVHSVWKMYHLSRINWVDSFYGTLCYIVVKGKQTFVA
jgi:hypothetical protein